jgi:hypothetical protein
MHENIDESPGVVWHCAHCVAVRCGIGNHVWLNVAPYHVVVLWQALQSVPKPSWPVTVPFAVV